MPCLSTFKAIRHARGGVGNTPEVAANCGWGDDGWTLSITAETGVYRIRLDAAGF